VFLNKQERLRRTSTEEFIKKTITKEKLQKLKGEGRERGWGSGDKEGNKKIKAITQLAIAITQ